jgi:predicted nuclease with TOPRIM domain
MTENLRRGMRDVTTLRTLSDMTALANRSQSVNRFARLENERTRLLRELNTWNARQQVAKRKLEAVEVDLAKLKLALLGAPSDQAARPRAPADQARALSEPAAAPARRAEVLIEY